VTHNWSDSDRQ